MKRNNWDSKVNIIFSLFPQKEPTRSFCPVAARRLWNAVKETASGITAWRYFFFRSGSDALVSSKSPPRDAVMYRGLFCWGVRGSDQRSPAAWNRTADPWCEWLMSNVTVKLNRGCCIFDFIGHHVRPCSLWSKDLQRLESLWIHTVEAPLNNMIFMGIHSSVHLFAQCASPLWLLSNYSVIVWISHTETFIVMITKIDFLIAYFEFNF